MLEQERIMEIEILSPVDQKFRIARQVSPNWKACHHEAEEGSDETSDGGDYDDSHSDSEEVEKRQKEDEIERRFREIRGIVRRKGDGLSDTQTFKDFAHTFGDYLNGVTSERNEQKTLLHLLVDDEASYSGLEKYKPVITHMIDDFPDLLEAQDRYSQTPLYTAVTKKRIGLVKIMCERHPDINSVLGKACHKKETCIHRAIDARGEPKLALLLIACANEDVLCRQDDQGNTPLHIAVKYKNSTDAQLKIVKTIVERCGQAMVKHTAQPGGLSPYLYHIHSRERES